MQAQAVALCPMSVGGKTSASGVALPSHVIGPIHAFVIELSEHQKRFPMCPSYVRLHTIKDEAMRRFGLWLRRVELEPPSEVPWAQAYDLATEEGKWRGLAFFVFERRGWTVFEDLTGFLSSMSGQDWLPLAADEELVFAGYNDSLPYAQMVVIRHGHIIREFLADEQSPAENTNCGRLDFEDKAPLQSWIDGASFVDGDELAVSPDYGTLWMFHRAI